MSIEIPSFSPPEQPDNRSILDSVVKGALNSLKKNFSDDNNSSSESSPSNSKLRVITNTSIESAQNTWGINIPDFNARPDSASSADDSYSGPAVLRSETSEPTNSPANAAPVVAAAAAPAIIEAPKNNANRQAKLNYLQKVVDKRTMDGINELRINPPFQTKVINFVYDSYQAGHKIEITDALRTKEEQRRNVAKWVSKTMNSKHLVGEAIDIIYPAYKGQKMYEIPVTVRQIAAKNGLWNGGDMWGWDYPHFQDKPSGASKRDLAQMSKRGTNPLDYANVA